MPGNHEPQASLKLVAAALHKTTRELAKQVPGSIDPVPDWTPFEWQMARVSATIHGIAPLLSCRLKWDGPDHWLEFLAQQRQAVWQRHQRIDALVARLDALAIESGIALTALKGLALHRLGLCKSGERPMADVDVLVRPQDVDCLGQVLAQMHYQEGFANWRHRMFQPGSVGLTDPFGEHVETPIKIEVHTRIAERLPHTEVDITSALSPASALPGIHGYRSIEALLWHLLLHAAGNMSARWLRLLQLHDIAQATALLRSDEWDELVAESIATGRAWWMYPPLTLTEKYFPATVPPAVLQALRRHCHRRLRRATRRYTISNVSGSDPWVCAAPAIEWAGSAFEVARYLHARIFPPAAERRPMQRYRRDQPWAAAGDWYSLTLPRRLVKWLFSRPGRPQILHAISLLQSADSPRSIATAR